MGATVREIAQRCKVSPATVSRVLNGRDCVLAPMRERVLRAVRNADYRPFRNCEFLFKQQAHCVALILADDFCAVEHNAFYSLGLRAVIQEMERRGGAVTIPSRQALLQLRDTPFRLSALRGVEGMLLFYWCVSDEEDEVLKRARVPIMVVGYESRRRGGNYIRMDIEAGATLAVRHLYSLGHRRIGYWGWEHSASINGFRRGLRECGLPVDEQWVVSPQHMASGSDVVRLFPWERLAEAGRPTAFLCHNDEVAVELIRRMRGLGFEAPRDYSVVGFDDLRVAATNEPALTTIRQPVHDMAIEGLQRLLEIMCGERKTFRRTVQPELIVRQSTGQVPGPVSR